MAVLVTGGCTAGAERALDPTHIHREPGWVAAGATPEVRQDDAVDCGPAALAMVAGHWSVPLSLDRAVELTSPDPKRGVKLSALRDAARSLGLRAFSIQANKDILLREMHAGRPVIVGLVLDHDTRSARNHYEVLIALRPQTDEVATLDPASGGLLRSWSGFHAAWSAAGHPALVVVRREPVGDGP